MDHRHLLAACISGVLLLGLGCEEDAPPPTVSTDTAPPVVEPERRTTDVPVTEQARKRLALKLIPFSINAPESWQVVSASGGETPLTMVEGPIVGDEVRITIGLRESVGGEVLRNLIKRMEKEDVELKKNGGGVTITEAGDLRVIDLRRKPAATTTAPSDQLMEWRITLLHPRGVVHEQYTLQFIGLTLEAYEANKSLLNEIIQSVKYDEAELTPLPRAF